uniref:MFS domain-containing protein n=1 Tax=Gongylonema pulchrum TaxID=637853 RepID=A0A183DV06_9BILA
LKQSGVFIAGIAYGADFAAIGVITVRWASLKQSGVFIAVLTSFNSLSALITNPVSGLLCESSFGWPAVYYVHAAFGAFIFIIWLCFYRDDPELHKNVSGDILIFKVKNLAVFLEFRVEF